MEASDGCDDVHISSVTLVSDAVGTSGCVRSLKLRVKQKVSPLRVAFRFAERYAPVEMTMTG